MDPPYLTLYREISKFRNHTLFVQFSASGLPVKDTILQGLLDSSRYYACSENRVMMFARDAHRWAAGGKADPFIQLRKAHGIVKTKDGFCSFVEPKAGEYMGEQEQLPLYDGKSSYIRNSLNPKWMAIEIANFGR